MSKVYSLGDEGGWTEEFSDVLYQLEECGELVVGANYYVADAITSNASDFFKLDALIDQLSDTAGDIVGECAEDFPELSEEKWIELESLIKDWLDKNVPITFYTAENIKQYQVTEADITSI